MKIRVKFHILCALALATFLMNGTVIMGMEDDKNLVESKTTESHQKLLTLENGRIELARLIAGLNNTRKKKTDDLCVFQYDNERYFEIGTKSLGLLSDFYTYDAQLIPAIVAEWPGKYIYGLVGDRRELFRDKDFASNTPNIVFRLTPITKEEFESLPQMYNPQHPKDHLGRPVPNWVSLQQELKLRERSFDFADLTGWEFYYTLGYKNYDHIHYPPRNLVYVCTIQQFIDTFANAEEEDLKEVSNFLSAILGHWSQAYADYYKNYTGCGHPTNVDMNNGVRLGYFEHSLGYLENSVPKSKLVMDYWFLKEMRSTDQVALPKELVHLCMGFYCQNNDADYHLFLNGLAILNKEGELYTFRFRKMKEVAGWNTLPFIGFKRGELQNLLSLPEEEKKDCWMQKVSSGRVHNVGDPSDKFYRLMGEQSLKTLEHVAWGVADPAYDLNHIEIRSKGWDHFFFIDGELLIGDMGIPYLL